MKDLFEHYDQLPKEVLEIISNFDHLNTNYNICSKLVKDLNKVGYMCQYGLDAIPFGLTYLEQ